FVITFSSKKNDISTQEILNKNATIFFYRNGEYFQYSGIINEFQYLATNVDYSSYQVTLVPNIYILKYNFQSRIFQKITYPDIIKQILQEHNLLSYIQINLKESYPNKEFVVQYQESDLDFIQRLMEEVGIFYFFKENPVKNTESEGEEKMIISDKSSSFVTMAGESSIPYKSIFGAISPIDEGFQEAIHRFSLKEKIVSKKIKAKNYNYRIPETDLSSVSEVPSGKQGEYYEYGQPVQDIDEMTAHADLITNRFTTEQIHFEGSGNCAGFRAGYRFTVKEHERADCNDTYLIRVVEHTFEHIHITGNTKSLTYRNDFLLVPSRVIDHFKPQIRTKKPNVSGILTAKIEGLESPYAALDEMGRYKVRLPFDLSDSKNYNASKYVRLAQPYSGSNYGIHFPSHDGAEMIVACVDGNPNKVMGIGTIPNPDTMSPVVSKNSRQSIIRTAGGNEMCMDDLEKKQKIHITTPDQNIVTLDDANDNISIETTDKNRVILDDKNKKCFWNSSDHRITMDYGRKKYIEMKTGSGHRIHLDDTDKSLTIYTKDGHLIKMDDKDKSIRITDCKGTNTVTLDGKKGISMESKETINITAEKDINIKAQNTNIKSLKKTYIDTTDEYTVKCGQAKTVRKKNGNTMIKGKKINMKATADIKMKGTKISQN
ncbi:MAG: type VI secretion system tip protein TssI/VgrG, partial [Chitinispirillia bacterium]